MDKKPTRGRIADAVRRGMGNLTARLSLSPDEYKKYVDLQRSIKVQVQEASICVNTLREKLLKDNKDKGLTMELLYGGDYFGDEMARAYGALHASRGSNFDGKIDLEIANREFLNNIVGENIEEVNKFYNLNIAKGTFIAVCSMVQMGFAKKYGCEKFEDLKEQAGEAKTIYKDFVDYRNGKLLMLKKLEEFNSKIKESKSEESYNADQLNDYEKLLLLVKGTKVNGLESLKYDDKVDARYAAKSTVKTSPNKEIFHELYSRLRTRVLKHRKDLRNEVLINAGITTGITTSITGALGLRKWLENRASTRKEADYQAQLQDLANDYGFNNIDELRGFVAAKLEILDTRDIATLQGSVRTILEQNKLQEINQEMGTSFDSIDAFMTESTKHTKTIEGMTKDQYLEGIVNRKGEVRFEGLDMQHERHVNEIIQQFSTENRDFFTEDGSIDYNALNDFIANNTKPGMTVTQDVVDAKLLQSKLEAEDQMYEARVNEVESMEWPQDVTYYDGKWADYINEIESIQDVFSTENGLLMHMDLLSANGATNAQLQAILIDAHNRFGDNWDNAVGWDEGWDKNVVTPPQGDVTVAPDAPVDTVEPPLSESDQDIIDAQQHDMILDGADKAVDNSQNVIDTSANIAMDAFNNDLGDYAGAAEDVVSQIIDTNRSISDAIVDSLGQIMVTSAIISTGVMAARIWLQRHNIIKARDSWIEKGKLLEEQKSINDALEDLDKTDESVDVDTGEVSK